MRCLTGTAFKSDATKFQDMASASLALCRAYVALYRSTTSVGVCTTTCGSTGTAALLQGSSAATTSGTRELAAARMHLRGVIKQCEGCFEGHVLLEEMGMLLAEVVALEEQSRAAQTAMQ